MDRLPEALMSFAAILISVATLIVSIWQQIRIDRNERWTRETSRVVNEIKANGTLPPAPPR